MYNVYMKITSILKLPKNVLNMLKNYFKIKKSLKNM